jgi:predicted Zn-dependent protease
MVAFPDFQQYAGVAQQGVGLLFLKFGRDDESQSDKLGVDYSTQIGYDAKEMADFFQTLKRLSAKGGQSIPTFLSTHPDPADRYNKVHKEARRVQANRGVTNLKVNRSSYLRMIDGLVYGEDPRQGYVENNVFYHPELKFEFNIPNSWQTINSPQQVQMGPEDGRAVMIMTLAQGKTLSEAETAMLQKYQMQRISSRNTTVNGLRATITTMEPAPAQQEQGQQQQQQQQQQIRVLSYLIEYNGLIYNFLGVSEVKDFNYFTNIFEGTMASFKQLNDSSKLNVKPERIKIITIAKNGTLEATLRSNGISNNRLEEFAILNGMELKDPVTKGMLLKVVSK